MSFKLSFTRLEDRANPDAGMGDPTGGDGGGGGTPPPDEPPVRDVTLVTADVDPNEQGP